MNAFDIALVVVVAAFIVYGAVKGLVRLALGSIALALGVLLGCWYHGAVEGLLASLIHDERVRLFVAFALVFLATLAAFGVLVWFITKSLEAVHLRWVDRLSGAVVGLVLASVLVGAALVPIVAFLPEDSTLVGSSKLSPYLLRISELARSIVPDSLKKRFEESRAKMSAAAKGAVAPGPASTKTGPPPRPPRGTSDPNR